MNTQIIIKRITTLCKGKGKTINQVLRETNLNKSFIDNIKKGSIPSIDKIVAIADYFNVSTDFLLGRTDYILYPDLSQIDIEKFIKEPLGMLHLKIRLMTQGYTEKRADQIITFIQSFIEQHKAENYQELWENLNFEYIIPNQEQLEEIIRDQQHPEAKAQKIDELLNELFKNIKNEDKE